MLTQRQLMIIFMFWKNKNQTGKQLSEILQCSERTIKNEMSNLQTKCQNYGFSISSQNGIGYEFQVLNKTIFQNAILPHIASYAEVKEMPDEKGKRIYQSLSLLFQETWVKAEDISDYLFIDKRTLNSTFQDVREVLKHYHLSLISKPYYGFSVQGDELQKRFCIMNLYAHYHHIPFLIKKDLIYQNFFAIDSMKLIEIRNIWLTFMRKQDCMIKDIHIEKFVYHILLSYHRFRKGYTIEFSQTEKDEIEASRSYRMIKSLRLQLHEAGVIAIDESEIYYLSTVLFCYLDVHHFDEIERYSYLCDKSKECVQDILQLFEHHYPTLSFPPEFLDTLLFALFPMVARMHYYLYEENTWLRNWRFKNISTSPVTLEWAFMTVQRIMRLSKNYMSIDDMAQLAFVYQSLLESLTYPYKKKKVLIIPSSGYASAQSLIQIIQQISYCIDSIEIRERYHIKNVEDIKKYDILISSPEYCKDFKEHITILYDYEVLEHRYHEMYDIFMGMSDWIDDFLPETFEYQKSIKASTVEDIFSLVLSPSQAKEEIQSFKRREDYIFNFGLMTHPVYFRFVEDIKDEYFCMVKLQEPIMWHNISIESLIICLIYPTSLLKCSFYDRFLKRLINNSDDLKYLFEHCQKESVKKIMSH